MYIQKVNFTDFTDFHDYCSMSKHQPEGGLPLKGDN